MLRLIFAVSAALVVGACTTVQPEQTPIVTPPEVTVLSDYPPVKAAVVPAIQALGYTVAQDTQFWTMFSKPGDAMGTPATRLTVTFASIRTHTRVIADTQAVRGTGNEQRLEPLPNHPDRTRIQAALNAAKAEVERQPASARRGAPPPGAAPVMPGTPAAPVARAAAIPAATPAADPMRGSSIPQAPSAEARPGMTRARVEGFRWPWQ